jgi:prolyl-tRNA synthetase
MGGSQSREFMVRTEAGEDRIANCPNCGYAANVEKATSRLAPAVDGPGPAAPEIFPTPGVRTIDDLARFPGGASADRQVKTLVFIADGELLLVLMRGDHELNETKLADLTGAVNVRPAHPDEIRAALGANAGSLGAVGVGRETHPKVGRIIADEALRGRSDMTTGANRDEHHLRGVDVERDIAVATWADLRSVQGGEPCANCGAPLEVFKAAEVGHIFKLGTKYSESMGARILASDGREIPIVMGSYGIGIERIIACAVELYHDDAGIIWPAAIAPFQVVVTPVNVNDTTTMAVAEELYRELHAAGIEALIDDRDERAGVKFKDADLIGIPYRLTVGRKSGEGIVELATRASRTSQEIATDQVVRRIGEALVADLTTSLS